MFCLTVLVHNVISFMATFVAQQDCMLLPHDIAAAITKFEDTDWRKKKVNDLKEVDTARKKHEEVREAAKLYND